jgi:hypothetical protein
MWGLSHRFDLQMSDTYGIVVLTTTKGKRNEQDSLYGTV